MSTPVNHFTHRTAAERYAAARPFIHPFIVERIRLFTGINSCDSILDVGCGTGQSTRPLTAIARRVVGIDQSVEMLAEAEADATPGIEYRQANAESLPFPAASFDLVTAGLAFHWFDQQRFLREVHRVLRPAGWLAIYNFVFLGDMETNPRFRDWFRATYLARYPTPPRHAKPLTAEFMEPCGMTLVTQEVLRHTLAMSREVFVGFLLTQSNVIAAVENGTHQIADVAAEIESGAAPYFETSEPPFAFEISITYLRRLDAAT
jgi:SAM-dependent methyltransferase